MTDYKKWDKMDFKSLGADSSESSGDDAGPIQRSDEYRSRMEEVETIKRRLKELEREQKIAEENLEASKQKSRKLETYLQVGAVVVAIVFFAVQYYFMEDQ